MRGCAFIQMLRYECAAAERLLDQSLQLCRSSGDAWGIAWSLYALAFLKLAQGDLGRSLEDPLVHLRQQGMTIGVFRTLLALGHALFELGDVTGAEALYRETLRLSQETPLLAIITTGLEGLAMGAAATGQPLRAARPRRCVK